MKKALVILILLIGTVSCTFDSAISSRRTSGNLGYAAKEALGTGMDLPMAMLYQAVRIDSYIKASAEEKKDPKYSDIFFNASTGTYVINDRYIVTPDDKSLFSSGSKWNLKYKEESSGSDYISTNAIADSCWNVTALMSSLVVKSVGTDKNGLLVLNCNVRGTYESGHEFWCSYSNYETDVQYWLQVVSTEGNISYNLSRKGTVRVTFFKGEEEIDWCILNYDGVDSPTYKTSVD